MSNDFKFIKRPLWAIADPPRVIKVPSIKPGAGHRQLYLLSLLP